MVCEAARYTSPVRNSRASLVAASASAPSERRRSAYLSSRAPAGVRRSGWPEARSWAALPLLLPLLLPPLPPSSASLLKWLPGGAARSAKPRSRSSRPTVAASFAGGLPVASAAASRDPAVVRARKDASWARVKGSEEEEEGAGADDDEEVDEVDEVDDEGA